MESPSLRRELLRAWVHLTVLWTFGVAQPLFGVLADEPAFFVVRDNTGADIILLTVGLTLAVPTAMVIIEALLAGAPAVRSAVHLLFVALLVGAIALQLAHGLAGKAGLAIAVAAGLLAAVAYARTRVVPTALTVLGPAPLVFALIFLFVSPVSELVMAQDEPETAAQKVLNRTPVVVFIWDELSATSLPGADGRVDRERFPNFAALARRSTWYPNATTVADSTAPAIPAILTGQRPKKDDLPTLSDHPGNLFTLLGPEYSFDDVYESASRLCPDERCGRDERASTSARLSALVEDLSVVSLHQLLPESLAGDLPPVDQTFADFRRQSAKEQDDPDAGAPAEDRQGRGGRVEDFTRRLRAKRNGRSLVVLHPQLPHSPLQYLPSGQEYAVTGPQLPGLYYDTWVRPWFARQALKRHLLQQADVDRLLGALVRRLKGQGLWDRAIVVVTADHGVNFGPSGGRRHVSRNNFAQVANVPLFVKLPGQRAGRVNRGAALTVDILPTIAAGLGIRVPWHEDGRPLGQVPARSRLTVMRTVGGQVSMSFAEFKARREAAVRYVNENLTPSAADQELVGRPTSNFTLRTSGGEQAELDAPGLFASVDPRSAVVPSYISGKLLGTAAPGQQLAIAINGTVRAVTRSYKWGLPEPLFSAIVAPTAFKRGSNRVEIFALERSGGSYALTPLSRNAGARLTRRDGREVLLLPPGQELPVQPGLVEGAIEQLTYNGNQLTVRGWAAERGLRPARRLLLFADERLIATTVPVVSRPDVAKVVGEGTEKSGFVIVASSDQASELASSSGLRVLATGDSGASQLELLSGAQVGRDQRP